MKVSDRYNTRFGCVEVIDYISAKKVMVKFVNTGTELFAQAGHIRSGNIKDPAHPSVYGVGYIGIGKYASRLNGKLTPSYITWASMIQRCYSKKYQKIRPTYVGCSVHKDWLNFQNFSEWFEKNYKEGWHLDKDIMVAGNKIYSESTCVFVPSQVNTMITSCNSVIKTIPMCLRQSGKGFQVAISQRGKVRCFGTYPTINEALASYRIEKSRIAKEAIHPYLMSGQLSNDVYTAFMQRIEDLK